MIHLLKLHTFELPQTTPHFWWLQFNLSDAHQLTHTHTNTHIPIYDIINLKWCFDNILIYFCCIFKSFYRNSSQLCHTINNYDFISAIKTTIFKFCTFLMFVCLFVVCDEKLKLMSFWLAQSNQNAPNAKKKMPKTRRQLNGNALASMDGNSLQHLSKLRTLRLEGNLFYRTPTNALAGLKTLEALWAIRYCFTF